VFSGNADSLLRVCNNVHGDLNGHSGSATLGPLDRAAEHLARAVREQWTREAELRSLHRPRPLRVRWSEDDSATPQHRLDDVVGKFLARPKRQLVVLGRPGSGKTVLALLLTLRMLAARKAGDPVPVLLTLSSWHPHAEHLHAWIARRLEEDYRGLTNRRAHGRNAALQLVRGGHVLPVLDGLDELPSPLHVAAVEGIDSATGSQMPLVVTCRGEDYERAVAVGGTTLSGAGVVELQPVGVEDVIEFLSTGPARFLPRWTPVFDHLRRHPDGSLATALSTPLMVDLARTAYRDPATDPAELLDLGKESIKLHLLDVFVPANYRLDPTAPLTAESTAAVTRAYSPHRAGKWLTFLASEAVRREAWKIRFLREHDFTWWNVPKQQTVAIWALSALGVGAFVPGLLVPFTTAVLGMVVDTFSRLSRLTVAGYKLNHVDLGDDPRAPRRISLRMTGRGVHIVHRAARGLLAGAGVGLVLGIVIALKLGEFPVWVFPVVLGLVSGVVTASEAMLTVPSDRMSAPDAVVELRQDRRAAGLLMLVAAAAVAGSVPLVDALGGDALLISSSAGPVAPFLMGACFGLGFVRCSAWIASWPARVWWALCGKLPWRLTTFLDDAHRRGVLRRTGTVYEFRHALLAERLAGATARDDVVGCQALDLGMQQWPPRRPQGD
jgi:hypothetical protein